MMSRQDARAGQSDFGGTAHQGKAMDEISRKVLQTIHGALDRLTCAENLTPDQLTEVFMATTALGYQIARMDYPADRSASVAVAEADLVDSAVSPMSRPRHAAAGWDTMPGARLCAAIEAGTIGEDPATLRRIRELLVAYHLPMDPVIDTGTRATYAGGRGDARTTQDDTVPVELTADLLQDWLRRNGHVGPDAQVANLKRLMGGYSKATYIARIVDADREQTAVIRKDSPGLPTGSSVVSEFPVLQEMTAIGVPVPAPLWIERDADLCGGAFMGVGFANGKPANQIVPTNPDVCREWAQSTAQVLARLHSGTALPQTDVREPIAAEIDGLEQRMLERERAPHPGLLVGLRWLRRNIDRLANRPACRIHGDVGFHNMLMDGGRITALLDWEFSRIGDPVEDLASIKPFMDQIGGWDTFYNSYQNADGFTVDRRAEDYFTVWQETRNMVACIGSLNSLLMPGVFEVPLTVAGTIYIPKYEVAIFDAISKAESRNE